MKMQLSLVLSLKTKEAHERAPFCIQCLDPGLASDALVNFFSDLHPVPFNRRLQ